MKKILLIILLLVVPISVNAKNSFKYDIDTTNKTIMIDEDIEITFDITLDEDKTGYISKTKIEIDYDENVVEVKDITSENYEGIIDTIDDKKYLLLDIKTDKIEQLKKDNNKNIKGVITFKMLDTDNTNTEIKLNNIEATLTSEEDKVYKNDLSKKFIYIISKKEEEKESNSNSNKESDNNYLESLVIEGYNIKFSKTRNNYHIDVKSNINKLDIKCILEDINATYEIIGNDNLDDNNHIYVNVISESGKKNTYVISINKEKEIIKEKLDTKAIIVIGIIVVIIVLLLILFIIHKIKENRLDKLLNKL